MVMDETPDAEPPFRVRANLLFHEWSTKEDWRNVELREAPRDERLVTFPIAELHGISVFPAEIEMDIDCYRALKEALKIGYAPEFRITDPPTLQHEIPLGGRGEGESAAAVWVKAHTAIYAEYEETAEYCSQIKGDPKRQDEFNRMAAYAEGLLKALCLMNEMMGAAGGKNEV
jgi:hypothetical protein